VDDNTTNLRILSEMLEGWLMQPAQAESGRKALAMIEERKALGTPFPLMLVDSWMPDTDGFWVAEQIQRGLLDAHMALDSRQENFRAGCSTKTIHDRRNRTTTERNLVRSLGQALG